MVKRVHYEDLIVNLYLFDRLDTGGGKKKAAKLIYLLEDFLYNQNIVGPCYVMKKYPMGPYADRLGTNLVNLTKNGYLKHTNRFYSNSATSFFLKEIDELIQENSIIFNHLDKILEQFGELSGDNIANYIYSLPKIGIKKQNFYKYNDFEEIIDPRKITKPKYKFFLDEVWYDTIEILLNPKAFISLQNAIEDCHIGNFSF